MATPPKKKTSTRGAASAGTKQARTSKKTEAAVSPDATTAAARPGAAPEMAQAPGPAPAAPTPPASAPQLAGGELRETIARRAYEIYEAEGRPEGRDEEHWRRAEAEVMRQRA